MKRSVFYCDGCEMELSRQEAMEHLVECAFCNEMGRLSDESCPDKHYCESCSEKFPKVYRCED